MNLKRLYEILHETTVQLRKGEVVHGDKHLVDAINEGRDTSELPGGVVTIDAMPAVSDAVPELDLIDLEFLVVGVHPAKAQAHKQELIDILKTYPEPDRLAGGPSYIEVGAVIGDQGAAFQLFALGQVLGLWGLVTPAIIGITDAEARRDLAGRGMVMITGFKPEKTT